MLLLPLPLLGAGGGEGGMEGGRRRKEAEETDESGLFELFHSSKEGAVLTSRRISKTSVKISCNAGAVIINHYSKDSNKPKGCTHSSGSSLFQPATKSL